jgi:hypothetical protein
VETSCYFPGLKGDGGFKPQFISRPFTKGTWPGSLFHGTNIPAFVEGMVGYTPGPSQPVLTSHGQSQ